MIAVIALVIAFMALLIALISVAAIIELFHSHNQFRDIIGLTDEPMDLDVNLAVGTRLGGNEELRHLVGGNTGLVLVVSRQCVTCHSILRELGGNIPEGVIGIIVANLAKSAAESWLSDYEISLDIVYIDEESRLLSSIGISTSPSCLVVHEGVLARAVTMPSHRALARLLSEVLNELSPKWNELRDQKEGQGNADV